LIRCIGLWHATALKSPSSSRPACSPPSPD